MKSQRAGPDSVARQQQQKRGRKERKGERREKGRRKVGKGTAEHNGKDLSKLTQLSYADSLMNPNPDK